MTPPKEWRINLLKAIRASGMDARTVSLKAKLGAGKVAGVMLGEDITVDDFIKVCDVIGVRPGALLSEPCDEFQFKGANV